LLWDWHPGHKKTLTFHRGLNKEEVATNEK
jgi:hypothetical protein